MTTPESPGPDPATPGPGRATRPEPERTRPDRSRGVGAEPFTPPPASTANMSDEVAKAVREGYDVITENIRQGRVAAERFRDGQYSMREIPGDLGVVGLRMLSLARELSSTTFDVCERLLKEMGASSAGHAGRSPAANPAPPFRPTLTRGAPGPSPAQATSPEVPARLKLTVRFTGEASATSPTTSLDRPNEPTKPESLTIAPLVARAANAPPMSDVSFSVDMAVGGLIATVAVPTGQPPGVYAGLVYAGTQEVPLGVLTVEIEP